MLLPLSLGLAALLVTAAVAAARESRRRDLERVRAEWGKPRVRIHRLKPGRATGRNAIAILRMRGAPASLVARALSTAEELDRQRAPGSFRQPDRTP